MRVVAFLCTCKNRFNETECVILKFGYLYLGKALLQDYLKHLYFTNNQHPLMLNVYRYV